MYLKTHVIKLIYITAITLLVSCGGQSGTITQNAADSTQVIPEDAKELSKLIDANPENAENYYLRARVYFNQKYLDRALADIEDAIRYNPQFPLYYFYKGKILYAMNRTLEASKAYEQAIALDGKYEEAQMRLAELYFVTKEHEKSVNLLNTVIAANPQNPDAQFFKAMNQKETGDTARAVASFQKALDLDPTYYDAAVQLGLLFASKKDRLALEYFNAALRIQPKSEEVYFARAYFYQLQKEYKKALMDYRKVIDINPSSYTAYYNVGVINFDAVKMDEALRSFDICVRMNPDYLPAYYMRGLVYEYKGNKESARINYQYVVDADPKYALAKEALQRVQ
jgi:tetratricopeptide (TPR) repeat protein